MKRNLLLSFAIHGTVLAGTILLYAMGGAPFMLVLPTLVGYTWLAYAWLDPLRSAISDFISVSFVSLVGLLIGLACLAYPGMMGFNWMIFLAYNIFSIPLAETVHSDFDLRSAFWLFPLPSLLMWAGLYARRWRDLGRMRVEKEGLGK